MEFWFAPEREMLQAAIDNCQHMVNGEVELKLYKATSLLLGAARQIRSIQIW